MFQTGRSENTSSLGPGRPARVSPGRPARVSPVQRLLCSTFNALVAVLFRWAANGNNSPQTLAEMLKFFNNCSLSKHEHVSSAASSYTDITFGSQTDAGPVRFTFVLLRSKYLSLAVALER